VEVDALKLKLRFLVGGSMIFLLGLGLGAVRGYGPGYDLLMGVGMLLLVLGLFWKDKPSGTNQGQVGRELHSPGA
jgi:hypothetical protein